MMAQLAVRAVPKRGERLITQLTASLRHILRGYCYAVRQRSTPAGYRR